MDSTGDHGLDFLRLVLLSGWEDVLEQLKENDNTRLLPQRTVLEDIWGKIVVTDMPAAVEGPLLERGE